MNRIWMNRIWVIRIWKIRADVTLVVVGPCGRRRLVPRQRKQILGRRRIGRSRRWRRIGWGRQRARPIVVGRRIIVIVARGLGTATRHGAVFRRRLDAGHRRGLVVVSGHGKNRIGAGARAGFRRYRQAALASVLGRRLVLADQTGQFGKRVTGRPCGRRPTAIGIVQSITRAVVVRHYDPVPVVSAAPLWPSPALDSVQYSELPHLVWRFHP